MDDLEKEIREKLKNYIKEDIEFLKSWWKAWINEGRYNLIEKHTGANVQVVYDILNQSKIKKIRKAKYDPNRYEIILHHDSSFKYEISVIIVFDKPCKGNIGVVTYYKQEIED